MKIQQKLIAIMFIYFAACSVIAPFMTIYLSQTLNPFEIGILMAIVPISMILFQPFWGMAADRWKTRRVLLFALFMTAVCAVGFTITSSFWGLLVVYTFYALFLVSLSPLIDTLTLSLCGGTYGGIRLWGSIGYGIGVFISGAFKSQLLGFWSFVIHSVLLLVTLCIVWGIPEAGLKKPLKGKTGDVGGELLKFLKNRRVLFLLMSLFLIGVVCKGLDNFFPVGISNMKASDLLLGTTWIIEIIPEIVLFYYLDKIINRVSAWYILIIGTAVFALRTAILGFSPILWVWIVSQPLSSVAFCCWYFGAVNLISAVVDEHQQATGQMFFWVSSYGIGGMVGSFLSGYLVNTYSISFLFKIAALFCAVSTAILTLLCKPQCLKNLTQLEIRK